MSFGHAIARARKARGLSQKQLAAKILKEDGRPISAQYLNDIERDRRNAPGAALIEQFARVLKVSEDYLYFLAGEIPPKDIRTAPDDPKQIEAAFLAFRKAYRRTAGDKNK